MVTSAQEVPTSVDEDDDLLRNAISDYAFANAPPPDLTEFRRRLSQEHKRRRRQALAAAAVVLVILGTIAAILFMQRPSTVTPVEPTPMPVPTAELPFPEQPRTAEGLPTGGVGDIIAGLRLDSISFAITECPDADRCPGSAALAVTNTLDQALSGTIVFTVYRNNLPAVGEGVVFDLRPGETTEMTIGVQPALTDNAPVGRDGSLYSWNVAVELTSP